MSCAVEQTYLMSRRTIGAFLIVLPALWSCTPYGTSALQDTIVSSDDVLADLKPVDTGDISDANNAVTDSLASDSGVEKDNTPPNDAIDTFVEVLCSLV